MKIPTEWTAVERIQTATVVLNHVLGNLPLAQFIELHPALGAVVSVLNDDPVALNDNRARFQRYLQAQGACK